ncbi:hypothetical protein INH39_16165 [Massilia violaceinigra]|uniref:Uncharacterized protein n=1 Tax=Massilia violaceinigra TaxID=2045208 RepID=A0ABY4AFV1_9BURK|nr:hypothetical protein [Massilia violaceinigra]UOD33030.1 hypothetical protein INH39_16165 [Massilia violaceinigra]
MKEELKVLLNKMAVIEREISEEKGALTFFALLLPWGDNAWELTVSAPWIDEDARFSAIDYIVDKYYAVCSNPERMMIAHVTIINTDDDELDDILDDYDVEHGMVKMKYSRYFDKEFDRGYIFTCKRRTAETSLPARAHAAGQPG